MLNPPPSMLNAILLNKENRFLNSDIVMLTKSYQMCLYLLVIGLGPAYVVLGLGLSCTSTFCLLGLLVSTAFVEPNGLPTLAWLLIQLIQHVEFKWKIRNIQIENMSSFPFSHRERTLGMSFDAHDQGILGTAPVTCLLFLLPFLSKQLGILFFLCLPIGLFARGGCNLNPTSTLVQCD